MDPSHPPDTLPHALVVEVAGTCLALPLGRVGEVHRGALPHPLPRAPEGCLGVLDLHGRLVPLLDAGALMGLRPLPPERVQAALLRGHLVRVRGAAGEEALLLVERVRGLGLPAGPGAALVPPEAGAGAGAGARVPLVDVARLLADPRLAPLWRHAAADGSGAGGAR
jgi:hypothetical protein